MFNYAKLAMLFTLSVIWWSNTSFAEKMPMYLEDSKPKFIADFISAWTKVMNLDRFDLK